MNRPLNSRSGQVGIMVILVMVVMSTIGISIASRASRDLQGSRQTKEATQTLSAAESAVENVLAQTETYLSQTTTGTYTDIPNMDVNFTIGQQTQLATDLSEGKIAEIRLVTPPGPGPNLAGRTVNIQWAESAACGTTPPSIIVSIVNVAGVMPISRHYAYAAANCGRPDNIPVVGTAGSTYARQVTMTLQMGDSQIRITPLYNDTPVAIAGGNWTLPVQQFTIVSTARNTEGRETKALQVERTLEYSPTVLEYALVSGTTILK